MVYLEGSDSLDDLVDVRSDITLWTSFFIVFTLIINGPLIAPLLKSFGLTKTSDAARIIQGKAKSKILDFSESCIRKYKEDDSGVFLFGADWYTVAKYVDLSTDLRNFGGSMHSQSQKIREVKRSKFDEDSFFSVLKALFVTLWQKLYSTCIGFCNIKALCYGGFSQKENSGNDSSFSEDQDCSSEHRDDDESIESVDFVNECHFQTIDRTLSRIEVLSAEGSSDGMGDIEQGMHESNNISTENILVSEESTISQRARSEDMNQVCLTGKAGQKLLEELQTTLSAEDSEPKGDLYYRSLPAEAGSKLQFEFQKSTQQEKGLTSPFQDEKIKPERNPSLYTDRHPKFKDLTGFFSEQNRDIDTTKDFSTTKEEMRGHQAKSARTLNATTGEYLRHELMKLKSNTHTPVVIEGRRRDLFGKRDRSLSMSPNRKETRGSDETFVSDYFAKQSNLKMLQQEAVLLQSNLVAASEPNESKRSDYSREYSNDNQGTIEANLKEIRSRLISGLKRRFMNRRAEGKISLKSFQVLDQACREEMSANGKLQVWSNLISKSQGGFITQGVSKLGFRITQRYKRSSGWVKWVLHYPHSWMSRVIREYLGAALLVSCEVAIEYTMALSISQHVRCPIRILL